MSRAAAAAPAPRLVLGLGARTARLQELGPALPTAREALAWLGTALEHRSACSGAAGRGPHAAEPAQDKPSSARGSGRAAHTQVPHGLSHQTAQADACVGRSKPEATPGSPSERSRSAASPAQPCREHRATVPCASTLCQRPVPASRPCVPALPARHGPSHPGPQSTCCKRNLHSDAGTCCRGSRQKGRSSTSAPAVPSPAHTQTACFFNLPLNITLTVVKLTTSSFADSLPGPGTAQLTAGGEGHFLNRLLQLLLSVGLQRAQRNGGTAGSK